MNPKYAYVLSRDVVIPELILTEFYGYLYRKYNQQTADFWLKKLSFLSEKAPIEILIKAIIYKITNKKYNLSFFDCVGYMFALENNIPFVTGDKQFQDKEGVEFIK